MPDKVLPDWEAGALWEDSRAHLTDMQRKIEEHEQTLDGPPDNPRKIKFIILGENVKPVEPESSDNTGDGSSEAGGETPDDTVDATGTVENYNPDDQKFEPAEELDNIVAPFGLPYDADDQVVAISHNGKYIPITSRCVRHAVTVKADGEYPDESDEPNVYPIKFVRLEFTEEAGKQTVSKEYLFPESEEPDAYVCNQGTEVDTSGPYLPEGSLVRCYAAVGKEGRNQWHTVPSVGGSSDIHFELAGELEKDSVGKSDKSPTAAYLRVWVPDEWNGRGRYLTDCNQTIYVADLCEEGFQGLPGATGHGVKAGSHEGSDLVEIHGLRCHTDNYTPSCGGEE